MKKITLTGIVFASSLLIASPAMAQKLEFVQNCKQYERSVEKMADYAKEIEYNISEGHAMKNNQLSKRWDGYIGNKKYIKECIPDMFKAETDGEWIFKIFEKYGSVIYTIERIAPN